VSANIERWNMDLNERKLKVLQAIISDFVATAEPVGSRTLSRKYNLGASPATIRNEMADLEEMGYLTHTHTSSGRIPSEKGYRFYVNELMKKQDLTPEEKEVISSKLYDRFDELDNVIEHAANILSEITNLTAFAITPKKDQDIIKYIRLLPVDENTVVLMIVSESGRVSNQALNIKNGYSDETLELLSKSFTYNYKGKTLSEALTMDIIQNFESDLETMELVSDNVMPHLIKTLENMLNVNLYMDGYSNIFELPEYSSVDTAKCFLDMIMNRKEEFTNNLISRDDGLMITIGNENNAADMKNCSLITATYHIDGKMVGKIGVIGPTRMRYEKVTSVIEYLSDNLDTVFTEIRSERGNDTK
jgi:heat-inducible transcriptional repressor